MSVRPPRSLAQALPYWELLTLPTGDAQTPRATYLLLKDGSLVLGLRSDGIDLTGAEPGQMQALATQWARIYASLPTQGFVQGVFQTGGSYDALIDDFAERSEPLGQPLLVRGRQEQARVLRERQNLVRAKITYWLGVRGALKMLLKPPRNTAQRRRHDAALAEAAQALFALALQAQGGLRGHGMGLTVMAEAEVLGALLAATAPLASTPAPEGDAANKASGIQAASSTALPSAPASEPTPSARLQGTPAPASSPTCVPGAQATPLATGQATPTPPWDAPRLCERLARGSIDTASDHLILQPALPGDATAQLRVLGMYELPASTEPSMLHALLFEAVTKAPLRFVLTHEKMDGPLQRTRLQQRRKLLFAMMGRYFLNHEAKQAYEQTEEVLGEMAQCGAQVMHTSLAVCVGPANAHDQVLACRQVLEVASKRNIALHPCEDLQLAGWLGTLPGNGCAFPLRYQVLHANAAHLTPVFLPSAGDACPDLLLGNRQGGLSKLSIRLGERHDASALIIGKTGSGKTFLFSWLAKYGCLDLGGHVVVADNKGPKNSSYKPLCELLGGNYVHLEHDDSVSFNPFPSPREVRTAQGTLDKQRLEGLESILFMMAEDPRSTLHPDYARNVVRRVVAAVYENREAADATPTLRDAVQAARNLRSMGEALQQTATSVAERLQLWCEDPVRRRLFDTPRTLQTHNKFTVFDFHGFTRDSDLAAVLISVLAQRIEAKMNELPRDTPKLFAFDEAWAMFDGSAEATSLLNRLYRTARSYGACVYTLTQSHHDITHSAAAQGIMANVGLVYLMRHQDGHAQTAAHFRLNDAQAALFADLEMVPGVYAESLLLDAMQNRTRILRYAPTPFDLWCDTSRADDVAMRDEALRLGGQSLEASIVALARRCPRGAPAQAWQRQKALQEVLNQLTSAPEGSVDLPILEMQQLRARQAS